MGNCFHSPERNQTPRGALTQFVTEMQIRHGEPALVFMKKRETAIEHNVVGNEGLVGAQGGHGQTIDCEN